MFKPTMLQFFYFTEMLSTVTTNILLCTFMAMHTYHMYMTDFF